MRVVFAQFDETALRPASDQELVELGAAVVVHAAAAMARAEIAWYSASCSSVRSAGSTRTSTSSLRARQRRWLRSGTNCVDRDAHRDAGAASAAMRAIDDVAGAAEAPAQRHRIEGWAGADRADRARGRARCAFGPVAARMLAGVEDPQVVDIVQRAGAHAPRSPTVAESCRNATPAPAPAIAPATRSRRACRASCSRDHATSAAKISPSTAASAPARNSSIAANTANATCSDSVHQRAVSSAAAIIIADRPNPSARSRRPACHASGAEMASASSRNRFNERRSPRSLASTCAHRCRRTCHHEYDITSTANAAKPTANRDSCRASPPSSTASSRIEQGSTSSGWPRMETARASCFDGAVTEDMTPAYCAASQPLRLSAN